MKHFNAIAALLLLPSLGLAGEKIDKALDFVDDGSIDISNVSGQVKVTPWDNRSVKVTGELGDYAKNFVFDRAGNRIRIKVEVRENYFHDREISDKGDNLVINVPRKSNVSYNGVSSSFTTGDLVGALGVSTVNGAVSITGNQGHLKATTVNGRMTIDDIKGDLEVHTVNGDVSVKGSSANYGSFSAVNGSLEITCRCDAIKISTVNGSADVDAGSVQDLNFSSISGGSRLRLGLKKGGNVNATTVNGHVTLGFIDDPSAYFSLSGQPGGAIVNNLTADKVTDERPFRGKNLQFTHLNGDGKVSVSTISGTITLEKAK